jgi:ComF family protein
MGMLRRLINGLVDIVYPKTCLACKNKIESAAIDNLVCAQCWAKIKRNTPPFCHSCGRHLEKSDFVKNICPCCLKSRLHFDRAFSPCAYTGVIKELIHAFKYNNRDYLGLPLSRLMIEFIREYNLPMGYLDFIVPIPLHKTRLREREFNQAQILAKFIAAEFKKEVLSDALLRLRHTKTQTELETQERLLNVKGSFSVNNNREIKGKNILLVDDVLTTGATSSEAAHTLKDAGTNIVFVLTLAN